MNDQFIFLDWNLKDLVKRGIITEITLFDI